MDAHDGDIPCSQVGGQQLQSVAAVVAAAAGEAQASANAHAHAQQQAQQAHAAAAAAAEDPLTVMVQLMQVAEARQAAMEAAAAVRDAEARVRAQKARQAAVISQLSSAQHKEIARFITAVSEEKAAENREVLAAAAVEQLRMHELEESLDDRHYNLKAKIKQLKDVSAEAKDSLFNELKAAKRRPDHAFAAAAAALAAAGPGCSVCGRTNHTADKCYAQTTSSGEALGGGKRPRPNVPGGLTPQQMAQAHAMFFPPMHMPQPQFSMMPPPQQFQQPYAQQQPYAYGQQHAAAAAGGAGVQQQQNGGAGVVCYNCFQPGHKSFQCPRPRGAPGLSAAAAAGPAGAARLAAGGAPNNPIVVSKAKHARMRTAEAAKEEAADVAHRLTRINPCVMMRVCDCSAIGPCISVPVNTAGSIDNAIQTGQWNSNPGISNPVQKTIEVSTQATASGSAAAVGKHGRVAADVGAAANVAASCVFAAEAQQEESGIFIARGESEASAYAAGAWDVEESPDGENEAVPNGEAGLSESERRGMHSCTAELYSSSFEGTRADTKNSHSNHDLAPVLSSRVETTRSLAALALQGRVLMPARVQSLRAAIEGGFGSKKKMLSDEAVGKQTCDRCKKTGHTAFSCPDQTQTVESDRTAADAWVRRLIDLPRVDVLAENAGLTLEQGVAKWRAKGEELNRGNPWEGSKKMEDSLKKRLGFHKAMGMSSVHLGWIGFGIPLQFIQEKHPAPLAFRNHASAMEEEAFVDAEHAANIKDGSFVKVARGTLRGICPLQVVRHPVSGKRRLVQDLRWINGHLPNVKFRMESLHKELGDVVQPGDKMLTTDIAKAYYCLALHPDAQAYLGWEWKGEFYMPTCLVFGLASAPRIFTKIMRPMMAFMRSLRVRVLGMIDDYLWAARQERILQLREAVRIVLPLLGWSFNAKCEWEPADEVLMLGMLVNAKKFEVRAPERKIQTTLNNIRMILAKQKAQRPVTIKDVQRVTGRLMSMMLALPGVRVFSRALYQCLATALEGNEQRKRIGGMPLVWTLQLKCAAVEELELWLQRLLTHNGLEINCRENQVQVLLWTDASDVGWGGEAAGAETRLLKADVPKTPIASMASGALPFVEIAKSSTRRELVALLKVAATPNILEQIKGKRIRVIMDSQPALANLLKGGGPVPELCAAVAEWVRFCEQHAIRPSYEWVERAGNWRADEASKLQSAQHTWKYAAIEVGVRRDMNAIPATQWRSRANHFVWGKVPLFLPMFHQIDARVEMIRAQLEEVIIVVPRWPAGGLHDWWRRIEEHSIARVRLGKVSALYAERPQTGHDDELEAFWLMGRRGDKNRRSAMAQREKQ